MEANNIAYIKRLNGIIDRDTQRIALWPNDNNVSKWEARIVEARRQLAELEQPNTPANEDPAAVALETKLASM